MLRNILILVFLVLASVLGQTDNGLVNQAPSSIASCEQNCLGNPACLKQCLDLYGEAKENTKLIRISIGIVVVVSVLISILIIACFFPCLFCPCHFYQKLKRTQNEIYDKNINEKNYQSEKNEIIKFLNLTQQKGTFSFIRDNKLILAKSHAKIIKEYRLKTKIKVWGYDDQLGDWVAHGYIVMKKQGITMWMYKIYEDKKKAGQIGDCTHLIFKSTKFEDGHGIRGKWYYENEEKDADPHHKGSWQIKMKEDYSALINELQVGGTSESAVQI